MIWGEDPAHQPLASTPHAGAELYEPGDDVARANRRAELVGTVLGTLVFVAIALFLGVIVFLATTGGR